MWKGKDWIPAMVEGLKLAIFTYKWGKCENLWENIFFTALHNKGFKRIMRGLLVREYFILSDTLPLKKGTFFIKISSFQNLKRAIYKGFVI